MLVWIAILNLTLAQAEYRAFELVIANAETGEGRTVISTLDPRQYRRYHPVHFSDQVTYRATWMCKGNTAGHKPICAKPEGLP
jgi:hypothetical protein